MAPTTPPPKTPWLIPKLNLRIEDLAHPGAAVFLEHIDPLAALKQAVETVLSLLYTHETVPTNIHAITLILREMSGVAHTTGSHTSKEIHFSLGYIVKSRQRAKHEIIGVLTHEVVHCYQYNGKGAAPGGLIEGIADWARLHAKLSPPHWKEGMGEKWDDGYEKTAYFLHWVDKHRVAGTVVKLNGILKDRKYDEAMFQEITDYSVDDLWKLYREHLDSSGLRVQRQP